MKITRSDAIDHASIDAFYQSRVGWARFSPPVVIPQSCGDERLYNRTRHIADSSKRWASAVLLRGAWEDYFCEAAGGDEWLKPLLTGQAL